VWDLSVIKNTKLTDRINLQFRAETFNAFNLTNFARPNAAVTTPANFGVVTQNLTGPGSSREIQFALKLLFREWAWGARVPQLRRPRAGLPG
jgi:hypothetical protein